MTAGIPTTGHLPGFAEPVRDAQRTFRAVLHAMARPTLPERLDAVGRGLRTPAPLTPGVGAVLLALCDEQTPIWLDGPLGASEAVRAWLRFHTGARLVDAIADAAFAVASTTAAPSLEDLPHGTDEAPHRSATLVLDVAAADVVPVTATGPGVDGEAAWDGRGLSALLLDEWRANGARYPRGVDLLLVDGATVRALPRTTMLARRDATLASTGVA